MFSIDECVILEFFTVGINFFPLFISRFFVGPAVKPQLSVLLTGEVGQLMEGHKAGTITSKYCFIYSEKCAATKLGL